MTDRAPRSLDRSCFAPGVRLHWSEVRQQHWLLFPEGALALNATAAAILACCDGRHSPNEIAIAMQTQFQGVNVSDIESLLLRLLERGLLVTP